MKPEISEQSKNEVEVLLENYVVSPLREGISKKMTSLEVSIENSAEQTASKFDESISSFNGNINRVKDKIEAAIDELNDEILTNREELADWGKNIEKQKSELNNSLQGSLSEIKQGLSDVQIKLCDTQVQLENAKTTLSNAQTEIANDLASVRKEGSQAITDASQTVMELLNNLESGLSVKIDKQADVHASFSKKMEELSAQHISTREQMEVLFRQEQELQKQLGKLELFVGEKYGEFQEQIDQTSQKLSTDLEKRSIALEQAVEQSSKDFQTSAEQTEKLLLSKYRTLWILLLSSGLINLAGIVTLILLYVL